MLYIISQVILTCDNCGDQVARTNPGKSHIWSNQQSLKKGVWRCDNIFNTKNRINRINQYLGEIARAL